VDVIETIRWNTRVTADLLAALLSQPVVIGRSALSLPHSLTYSFTHAPIHTPPTRASQFAPAHIISHPLPHSLLHPLNPTYIPPLTPTHSFNRCPTQPPAHPCTHSPSHAYPHGRAHMLQHGLPNNSVSTQSHTHQCILSHTSSHTQSKEAGCSEAVVRAPDI
jgi:hypothetical protein